MLKSPMLTSMDWRQQWTWIESNCPSYMLTSYMAKYSVTQFNPPQRDMTSLQHDLNYFLAASERPSGKWEEKEKIFLGCAAPVPLLLYEDFLKVHLTQLWLFAAMNQEMPSRPTKNSYLLLPAPAAARRRSWSGELYSLLVFLTNKSKQN